MWVKKMKNILKENLGEYYEKLNKFLVEIYNNYREEEYFKIVISSEHCRKILNLWLCSDDEEVSDEVKFFFKINCISTDELFKMVSDIITKYKEEDHILPRIVRIDSLIFHGIRINRDLLDYENALLGSLAESESEKEYLKDRLVHLTRIHVFAVLSDPLCLLSRYRRLLKMDMILEPISFYLLQMKLMNALNENVVGESDVIDRELVEAVDEAISQLGYETERDAVSLYKSGIFFGDEQLAKWPLDITLKDFVDRCAKLYNSFSTDDVDVIKSMLALRERQGYISFLIDKNGNTIIRANEQSLLIKPIKYVIFVPLLKELQRRVRESQLDLKREISRMLDNLPTEMRFCTVDEIYTFLCNLESINRGIDDLPSDISLAYRDRGSFSEASSKSSYYLSEYKKI